VEYNNVAYASKIILLSEPGEKEAEAKPSGLWRVIAFIYRGGFTMNLIK
jgi:hypothetical protein